MKIVIFGRNKEVISKYKKQIKKNSLVYDEKNPDIVISLGGDGTFLMAERVYPGVPKLLIRDKNVCIKCDWDSLSPILNRLKNGKYKIEEHRKLEAIYKKKVFAINDIVIRNDNPVHAIRFFLSVNGKRVNGELIGDGVVIATPFGSTAYYYSITKKTFKKGIGIAFNNLAEKLENMNVSDNAKVDIKITRGNATLSWDNEEKTPILKKGDKIIIKLSKETAKIVKIK